MKSRTTTLWFVLAGLLAGGIWVLENYFQPAATGQPLLFDGLYAGHVTEVQIIPGGAREISVLRTNQSWLMQKPVLYPAQAAAIDGLLGALEKLKPVLSFSAGELNGRKNADAEFGFDNPQFTLDITAGGQEWHLRVGNKTAPGDGVYVRVVGTAGACVTETEWLQFLPHDANDWRDTTLLDMPPAVDWLVITNGTQAIELRRNVTNRLWRMVHPLPARADNLRILTALQQLRTARVSRFVNDDAKPDLAAYGLQPAALDVWLGSGTNLLAAIHAGKDVTGSAGEVYARREGWDAIVATPKEPLSPWRGAVNDFRATNLLELTAPVGEIEVRGENNFTLQRQGSNIWTVAGEKFPADTELVNSYIHTLASLHITHFVQDVVTAAGLQSFGLAAPQRQITLRAVAGDTNSVIAQLLFGATTTNEMYVKRGDEDFVYALAANQLPPAKGDYFRERHVWNIPQGSVAQVTLRQGGKMRQLVHTGTNEWTLAAGSGIINPPAVEEAVYRLGQLTVAGWLGRKFSDSDIGINTNSLSITMELKSGEKYTLDFGRDVAAQTALAVITLEGERWALVFPTVLYPLVAESLTIPADKP